MTISESQYVDLLVKKLYGVAKTDTPQNKSPTNEPIPSPELNRGDTLWTQANQIPATPANIANLVFQYSNSNPIQCVADTQTVPIVNNLGQNIYPTWLTNVPEWIPSQFGASYTVNAYVGPANIGNLTNANVTFIAGSGEGGSFPGEYFFDYQAGLLNFIGNTIPNVLTTGNVVYITGYAYTGLTGVTNLPSNTSIGNLTVATTTINSNLAGNLVTFGGNAGIIVPVGNTTQRPSPAVAGTVRFNTVTANLETWTGNAWSSGGSSGNTSITTQIIVPDGASDTFTLNQASTSGALLVAINGVEQTPGIAYAVSGNLIAFSEVPLPSDTVVVRFITTAGTTYALANDYGNTTVQCLDTPAIQFQISGSNAAVINSSRVLDISAGQGVALPSFTVSQAGNLSNVTAGTVIYVSNGDSGNPCLAVYSGGAFKRISLGANIST